MNAIMECEVCGSTENVKDFDAAGRGILIVPVCSRCYESGRFKGWLAVQMEMAMNQHPNFERIGHGLWKRKNTGES